MKLTVTKQNEQYDLQFQRIVQLCGISFKKKKYILESLKKYFSSERYAPYEETMEENIYLDGALPGRRYFEIYAIADRSDLLDMIQLGRKTLMSEYLKYQIQEYSLQSEVEKIIEIFTNIYNQLNQTVMCDFLNIQMDFRPEELFDIIQKSEITTDGEESPELLSDYELLKNVFVLIEKIQSKVPRKIMVIIENIDHLVTIKEYENLFRQIDQICKSTDTWVVFSMSVEGFVFLDEKSIEGINIINDEVISCPPLEKIQMFVERNYPCHKDFTKEELTSLIRASVNRIGNENVTINQKSDIFLKMVNSSLCIDTKVENTINNVEKNYLEA